MTRWAVLRKIRTEASVSYGTAILEAQLTAISFFVKKQQYRTDHSSEIPMGNVATIWEWIDAQKSHWMTSNRE